MSQWSVVGLAMSFYARVGLVTSSRSIPLRRLSMVFPKTILLKYFDETVKMMISRHVSLLY